MVDAVLRVLLVVISVVRIGSRAAAIQPRLADELRDQVACLVGARGDVHLVRRRRGTGATGLGWGVVLRVPPCPEHVEVVRVAAACGRAVDRPLAGYAGVLAADQVTEAGIKRVASRALCSTRNVGASAGAVPRHNELAARAGRTA